jgi:GTP cyclohydrolase I
MTTLTVTIDNKKSEKAVKAVLDALGLNYNVELTKENNKPLNKSDQKLYDSLKRSLEHIKLHQEGKIELRDARELINELQG